MNLDLFSVTVMTAIVASVASLTFIIDTLLRRDTGPDGCGRWRSSADWRQRSPTWRGLRV